MQSSSKKREVGSLGRIGDARLDLVPSLADCNPGIRPVEYNVVIATAPSTDSDKIGSVFIPDEAKETLDLAMQVGRIVAQSPLAYSYEKWPEPNLKPQIGQIVWFARYAGKEFVGADGKDYRILKDKDIGAVIEEPGARNDFTPPGYLHQRPIEPDEANWLNDSAFKHFPKPEGV